MAYDSTQLEKEIEETKEWLARELSTVRTGRATPALLDGVKPEAYGVRTPLRELAAISVEDPRTLRVIPWDNSITQDIEKSVVEADLGVGVAVDDQGLRISFPELTADRRTQLRKMAGDKTEQARVTTRGHRTEAIKALEAAEKEGGIGKDEVQRVKNELQKLIDAANDEFATLLERKEKEISQ